MKSPANKGCGNYCPQGQCRAKEEPGRFRLSRSIGRWTGVSTLLISLLLATPAPADPLKVLDGDLARFEQLVPRITDEPYRNLVIGVINNFKNQLNPLRTTFDQARCDELRVGILVETQRVNAWLNPPPVASSGDLADLSPKAETPRPLPVIADSSPPDIQVPASFVPNGDFLESHCTSCHDDVDKKGGLDLTSLAWSPGDSANFATWVKVHDNIRSGEMPPKKKKRPDPAELEAYIAGLSSKLTASERETIARDGRSPQRRLNAYEYENALRDLLNVPWLQIKGSLPDDGVAYRFNKSGKALDVSHVQVSRFLTLADTAIRDAISVQAKRPPTTTRRFHARDQKILIKEYQQVPFNTWPDRQNFPLLGSKTEVDVRLGKAPLTVGITDPAKRDLEAVGWLGIAFPKWDRTPIPVAGRYRVRFSGYTIWAGPNGYSGLFKEEEREERIRRASRWFLPDIDTISPGRRDEPVSIYAEADGQTRRIGEFDLTPEPGVYEIETWLGANESVMPRATRLYQPRPPLPTNPNARPDGAPGVAFRWLEIEGPLYDDATTSGYRLMFGELPLTKFESDGETIEVNSQNPKADAARLLHEFLGEAYRRAVDKTDEHELLALIHAQLDAGTGFAEAMIAGYTAALASPGFLILREPAGKLDNDALAARLSLFLWNSPPDRALRKLAASVELHRTEILRRETERLLDDPKSERFVEAFLDYWLELRKLEENTPSITLYNDYYLDDALVEAARAEPRLFFAELLQQDLPAGNIVDSDFTYLNERLAKHYGVPGVAGVAMRKVKLPADSPRGGLMTQASVLKVTANGTTTSPVLRGKWITERILGQEIPPPPPVAAVEPDIRGAVTIRQQLEKHRSEPSCASCHDRMDPPGFALENFDIFGGWRDRYRAISPGMPPVHGFGKNGAPFEFFNSLPVDAAGELPDGRTFKDVRQFKQLLLENEARESRIARNLVQQLVIYATGSPVRFTDRPAVEKILRTTAPSGHGVRHIVHEIIQSDLFLNR